MESDCLFFKFLDSLVLKAVIDQIAIYQENAVLASPQASLVGAFSKWNFLFPQMPLACQIDI